MATVYLETTIPSYLVSRLSRDLVVAAHQQLTRQWWDTTAQDFELFISEAVLEEIRGGDPEVAARRLAVVDGLPILAVKPEALELLDVYTRRLGLHPAAETDLLHIAIAVSHELDYLLTWNCRHIANGQVIRRLMKVNQELGQATPLILTPEELFRPSDPKQEVEDA